MRQPVLNQTLQRPVHLGRRAETLPAQLVEQVVGTERGLSLFQRRKDTLLVGTDYGAGSLTASGAMTLDAGEVTDEFADYFNTLPGNTYGALSGTSMATPEGRRAYTEMVVPSTPSGNGAGRRWAPRALAAAMKFSSSRLPSPSRRNAGEMAKSRSSSSS